MDWIDEIKEERASGRKRALTQSQHKDINSKYPGLTMEECCECGEYTGKAGEGEDSLYDNDNGPFCNECWDRSH